MIAYGAGAVVGAFWVVAFIGACCFIGESLYRFAGWLARRDADR